MVGKEIQDGHNPSNTGGGTRHQLFTISNTRVLIDSIFFLVNKLTHRRRILVLPQVTLTPAHGLGNVHLDVPYSERLFTI
jgi:hypothetical protein